MINGALKTIEDLGQCLTFEKIVPGATATGISANVYQYNLHTLSYDSGGTVVMAAGDTVVGGTSAATGIIVSRTIATGTDAGGDAAGVLTLKCVKGTFQNDEALNVEGNANVATVDGTAAAVSTSYLYKGKLAKAALVAAENKDAYICIDGAKSSQTQKAGLLIPASGSWYVIGTNHILNAKVIDAVNGSATTIKVMCFF